MADEGFREYYSAHAGADAAIHEARAQAASLPIGPHGEMVAALVLGLVAVARAVQAQTLGVRHAVLRVGAPARWRE